jgi:K+-sensing histidine kinase KdpD
VRILRKKVLVCITPQVNSKRLIDKGKEIAGDAELFILHVSKGRNIIDSAESVALLELLFTYAGKLGGVVLGMASDDVYKAIKKFILKETITNVVLGAPAPDFPTEENSLFEKLKLDFPYIETFTLPREQN